MVTVTLVINRGAIIFGVIVPVTVITVTVTVISVLVTVIWITVTGAMSLKGGMGGVEIGFQDSASGTVVLFLPLWGFACLWHRHRLQPVAACEFSGFRAITVTAWTTSLENIWLEK